MVNKEILDDEWDSKDTNEMIAHEVLTYLNERTEETLTGAGNALVVRARARDGQDPGDLRVPERPGDRHATVEEYAAASHGLAPWRADAEGSVDAERGCRRNATSGAR